MALPRIPRKEADARGWLCRSHLRKERLLLAPGQVPVAEVWFSYQYAPVYDRALCVPMRAYRPATPAQAAALEAGRDLVGTRPCRGCGERIYGGGLCSDCEAAATARAWLEADPLILDTETTGLDDQAEVIEISVIDARGEVLLDTLVRPTKPIPVEASAIHGITDADVAAAPTWADIHGRFVELVAGRRVVVYNADFDAGLIHQTAARYGLDWRFDTWPECAMRLYAKYRGDWNSYRQSWRWHRLIDAAAACGIDAGGAHRALADCRMTLGIIQAMAALEKPDEG